MHISIRKNCLKLKRLLPSLFSSIHCIIYSPVVRGLQFLRVTISYSFQYRTFCVEHVKLRQIGVSPMSLTFFFLSIEHWEGRIAKANKTVLASAVSIIMYLTIKAYATTNLMKINHSNAQTQMSGSLK